MFKFRNYFLLSAVVLAFVGSFLGIDKEPAATPAFLGAFLNVFLYIIAIRQKHKQVKDVVNILK